jgi:hypothetical protein
MKTRSGFKVMVSAACLSTLGFLGGASASDNSMMNAKATAEAGRLDWASISDPAQTPKATGQLDFASISGPAYVGTSYTEHYTRPVQLDFSSISEHGPASNAPARLDWSSLSQ